MSARVFKPAVVVCLLWLATTSPLVVVAQRGALVVPRNAAQLAAQAQTIVRGRVASARVEPDPRLPNLTTVVVTLKTEETLKGAADRTFTFRQFIWDIRDRVDAAGYRKGQEMLLMMNAPTRLGLSTPAGVEQGRFRIFRDATGREMAVNGHNNAELFRNVEALAAEKGVPLTARIRSLAKTHQRGPVQLEDLRTVIKQFAEVQ